LGADIANLSPPVQQRVCSQTVSGMGGMSSVPCARERAELVRAWWVTASGSGVAICGDTGKKLDRPVPAGFETVPQGIRVNLRVRDASGITTKPSNRTLDVRRASRTPLIAPGFCPWRVSCWVLFLPIPWGGGPAKRGRGAASAALCQRQAPPPPGAPRRPLRPLLRQGYGGPTSPCNGEENARSFPRTCSGVQ